MRRASPPVAEPAAAAPPPGRRTAGVLVRAAGLGVLAIFARHPSATPLAFAAAGVVLLVIVARALGLRRAHVSARALGACACLGACAYVWAAGPSALPVALASVPPLPLVLATCAVGVASLWMIFRSGAGADLSLTDLSSGGGAGTLNRWRAAVPARWPDAARSAGLVRVDPYDGTRVLAEVTVVGKPVRIRGGVALVLSLAAAGKLPEDVVEAARPVRAGLRAGAVLVERFPQTVDHVILHVYRAASPFWGSRPVDWRTLRPVDPADETVPVGETAYADVSGSAAMRRMRRLARGVSRVVHNTAAAVSLARRGRLIAASRALASRPVLGGQQAVLSWRVSTLVVSLADMGKSALIRAYLRGLLVQGIPFRVYMIDNKGDFRALREAVEATGGRYVSVTAPPSEAADLLSYVVDVELEPRYAALGGYDVTPDDEHPLIITIVGEWQDFIKAAPKPAAEDAEKLVRRYRAAAGTLLTTAQAAQQKALTIIRDMFPAGVLGRVDNDSAIDMVLGEGQQRRGAYAYEIPAGVKGIHFTKDRLTGWPFQFRAAWVPPEDQEEALIQPIREMAARMRPPEPDTGGEVIELPITAEKDAPRRRA
jgi:hypothetical protein